jgi:Arc/MetJ-type ribon-helix-helix transcriptional regulator
MNVDLRPELEALIRQDLEHSSYSSVHDFVEEAVLLLHQQEIWLNSHRAEIGEKIEEGWMAAERGELLEEPAVREWGCRSAKLPGKNNAAHEFVRTDSAGTE